MGSALGPHLTEIKMKHRYCVATCRHVVGFDNFFLLLSFLKGMFLGRTNNAHVYVGQKCIMCLSSFTKNQAYTIDIEYEYMATEDPIKSYNDRLKKLVDELNEIK